MEVPIKLLQIVTVSPEHNFQVLSIDSKILSEDSSLPNHYTLRPRSLLVIQ